MRRTPACSAPPSAARSTDLVRLEMCQIGVVVTESTEVDDAPDTRLLSAAGEQDDR